MENEHIWTASGTDITIRWRTHYGWVPPSELLEYQKKWAYYQELPLRKLDEKAREEFEKVMQKSKVKKWRTT